jgi:hypothetical protein
MKKLLLVVALTCFAGSMRVALAAEPSVVVLEPQHNLQGDVAQVLEDVRGQVGQALGAGGWSAMSGEAVEACASGQPGGVTDPTRLRGTAESCSAQAAVGVQIDASAMGYSLRLVVVGFDGSEVADVEGTCDFCTETEMVAKCNELAAGVGRPSPALVAAAEGGGAEPTELTEPTEPTDPTDPTEPADGSGFSVGDVPWWVWAGGAVSLGLIGGGAPLVAIDGDITCSSGPVEACPDVYDTDAAGWTMIAVGIAGLGAVGVGLYFVLADDEEDPADAAEGGGAEAEVAILPGLGGLVVAGSFDL